MQPIHNLYFAPPEKVYTEIKVLRGSTGSPWSIRCVTLVVRSLQYYSRENKQTNKQKHNYFAVNYPNAKFLNKCELWGEMLHNPGNVVVQIAKLYLKSSFKAYKTLLH